MRWGRSGRGGQREEKNKIGSAADDANGGSNNGTTSSGKNPNQQSPKIQEKSSITRPLTLIIKPFWENQIRNRLKKLKILRII